MTNRPYRPEPVISNELRRPIIPAEMSSNGRLFLGWGPRV